MSRSGTWNNRLRVSTSSDLIEQNLWYGKGGKVFDDDDDDDYDNDDDGGDDDDDGGDDDDYDYDE